MHLDRDDLGNRKDEVEDDQGRVIRVEQNQETVTIRGYMQGQYVVNVFMYDKAGEAPTPVTTQIVKLNPFQIVHEGTVFLNKDGSEHTIARFFLDKNGLVVSKNNVFKSLAKRRAR
jgi:hypothetical protein